MWQRTGRDCIGRADWRLRRGRNRQGPDAKICGDRPALCRSAPVAVGRSRAYAPLAGYFRPRHGGRKPGSPDYVEQRAAAGDPEHPSRQGSGVRRRLQERPGRAARVVRDREPLCRECQARPDLSAGSLEPSHQRQETGPQLHHRYRALVARPGQGGDARERDRRGLSCGIEEVAGRGGAARNGRSVGPAQGTAAAAAQCREYARGLQGGE